MISFKENQGYLKEEIKERLKKYSSSILSDSLNELGYKNGNVLPASIKGIEANQKIIGLATTIYAPYGNSLPFHLAIYKYAKNRVLVVETGNYEDGPYIGDILTLTAKLNLSQGFIINGYIRDMEDIRKLDFPIFCKGAMPNKPSKKDEGTINHTIKIGNVEINSGDIIVADEDGIVVIPLDKIEKVMENADKKLLKEEERKDLIKSFNFSKAQELEDYLDLMTKDVREYILNRKF
nr:RraA family protein [uncultured Fusobacterium sp.]